MLIAPPYYPRPGEWERLSESFPKEHTYIVIENDQGVDSADSKDAAKDKLSSYGEQAAVVQRLGSDPMFMLTIWR